MLYEVITYSHLLRKRHRKVDFAFGKTTCVAGQQAENAYNLVLEKDRQGKRTFYPLLLYLTAAFMITVAI